MRKGLTARKKGASRRSKLRAAACPALALPMTQCECAGITFVEIGRLLEAGETLPSALARTGCADMCTACLPDLDSYLAKRKRAG
jgi:bacterioferritin-associated ferredoxin